jgi:hypothetical protein
MGGRNITMAQYTLTDHTTGEIHELEYENIVDIQAALNDIVHFNNQEYPYATPESREKIFMNNCFSTTLEIMNKVQVPLTDY